MVAPYFQGSPYIIIVQLDEILQTVGLLWNPWINVII